MNTHRPILKSSVLVKPTSADCNLECGYCFYRKKAGLYPETKKHIMSDAVLEALIQQVMRNTPGEVSMVWQGGEPTLAGLPFFMKVVEFQKKYGLPGQVVGNALQTNGILLNEQWASFLSKYRFLVGLSIDGPQELHDYYRRTKNRQPTFSTVFSKIDLLRSHNVAFNILMVISSANVGHPDELYGFCRDNGLCFVQFIPTVEIDSGGFFLSSSVAADRYGDFLCSLFDLWFNNGRPQISIRLFDSLLIRMAYGSTDLCSFGSTCDRYLVVEANGDVYPCDFFVDHDWRLGNLIDASLWELEALPLRQKFSAQKSELPSACARCDWVFYCMGECPRYRGLSATEGMSYFCESYKQFFEHSLSRLKEIASLIRPPKVIN
ncbi:MAG: anaerobic sulfatase maturase [Thermodesulfovibrionales bacterium]|jgi:uncharacterized protein